MQPFQYSWVGGEHYFALPIGPLRALQEKCDAGPHQIFNRMSSMAWRIDDVLETIRQGLIGGGMTSEQASRIVLDVYERHPPLQYIEAATKILEVFLVGPKDDPAGEAEGVTTPAPSESGVSANSTDQAQ